MQAVRMDHTTPVSFASNGSVIMPEDKNAAAWAAMEFEQGCCGIRNREDYVYYSWNRTIVFPDGSVVNATFPPSCCMLKKPNTVPETEGDFVNLSTCLLADGTDIHPDYVYNKGCTGYVMQQATRYNFVYAVVAAGMSGLQGIILCLTLWLLVLDISNKV